MFPLTPILKFEPVLLSLASYHTLEITQLKSSRALDFRAVRPWRSFKPHHFTGKEPEP